MVLAIQGSYHDGQNHSSRRRCRAIAGWNSKHGCEDAETPEEEAVDLTGSSEDEKQHQLRTLTAFQERYTDKNEAAITELKAAAREGENTFEVLMEAVKYCSLGQITEALFEVGGEYRRNM